MALFAMKKDVKGPTPADYDGVPGSWVDKAQAAYDANDSASFNVLCERALKEDPNDARVGKLMARFGWWDSVSLEMDVPAALTAARRVLEAEPEEARAVEASEIYLARKKQVSEQLEAAMMMPSYTGSKQVHQVMMDWQQLLVGMPDLPVHMIEEEVTLCSNLCLRSKMGVMPADRMVYVAYATHNGKVSYGDAFRTALTGRMKEESQRAQAGLAKALEESQEALAELDARKASGDLAPEEERALLQAQIDELAPRVEEALAQSGTALYEGQIEELKRQKQLTKPYKVLRRRDIDAQIEKLEAQAADAARAAEESARPLQEQLDALRKRLAGA